jgi:hypothetical protein
MKTLLRHSLQTDESQTHRIRSVVDSFGLFTERLQNTKLMSQSEDLSLERRTPAE